MSLHDGRNAPVDINVKGFLPFMTRFVYTVSFFLLFSLLPISAVQATSTQYGDTGLFSQPTAQTLNEGNICIGLWTNCADSAVGDTSNSDSAVIVPATITMGLGTFMETYGSYPDLLFNGDEDASGRGFANAGFKFRVFGKRSAPFRLAIDLQGRRSISDDPNLDGLTDYSSRFIASFQLADTFAVHGNAGYVFNDSPAGASYDDQVTLGAGVEYSLATRLRLIGEFSADSEKISGRGESSQITAGIQYYVTPHLTMNLAASVGRSDDQPDWRILLGMSSCQGVGTFNRPVPKLVDPEDLKEKPESKPVKISKIRVLTPLLSNVPISDSPISRLEIPVEDPNEAVWINPADRLNTPTVKPHDISPLSPIGKRANVSGVELPDEPFPTKVSRRFRFPELTYAFNQWDLSAEGRESISLVAEELRREDKFFIVSIEGHTDDVGSEAYNQILSFKRAVAAATHLVLRDGFDPGRIFVKGQGESMPIDDNNTDEGRARNRRVELLILVPEGYEHIKIRKQKNLTGGDNSAQLQNPLIDPLSIEQAIMDKTGAETAKPAGTFSQVNKNKKANGTP